MDLAGIDGGQKQLVSDHHVEDLIEIVEPIQLDLVIGKDVFVADGLGVEPSAMLVEEVPDTVCQGRGSRGTERPSESIHQFSQTFALVGSAHTQDSSMSSHDPTYPATQPPVRLQPDRPTGLMTRGMPKWTHNIIIDFNEPAALINLLLTLIPLILMVIAMVGYQ